MKSKILLYLSLLAVVVASPLAVAAPQDSLSTMGAKFAAAGAWPSGTLLTVNGSNQFVPCALGGDEAAIHGVLLDKLTNAPASPPRTVHVGLSRGQKFRFVSDGTTTVQPGDRLGISSSLRGRVRKKSLGVAVAITAAPAVADAPIDVVYLGSDQGNLTIAPDDVDIFISPTGNDANPCTATSKCLTFDRAISLVPGLWLKSVEIHMDPGAYPEAGIFDPIIGHYIGDAGTPLAILGAVTNVRGDRISSAANNISATDVTLGVCGLDQDRMNYLEFTTGPATGQRRQIIGNTVGCQFNVNTPFSPAPVAGNTFRITRPSAVINPFVPFTIPMSPTGIGIKDVAIEPSPGNFVGATDGTIIQALEGVRLTSVGAGTNLNFRRGVTAVFGSQAAPWGSQGVNNPFSDLRSAAGVSFIGSPGNATSMSIGAETNVRGALVSDDVSVAYDNTSYTNWNVPLNVRRGTHLVDGYVEVRGQNPIRPVFDAQTVNQVAIGIINVNRNGIVRTFGVSPSVGNSAGDGVQINLGGKFDNSAAANQMDSAPGANAKAGIRVVDGSFYRTVTFPPVIVGTADGNFVGVDRTFSAALQASQYRATQINPPSVVADVACLGVGGTAVVSKGTDNWLIVTLTTGAGPAANARCATVTMQGTYANAPVSLLASASQNAAGLAEMQLPYVKDSTATPNTIEIFSAPVALSAATVYVFAVFIGGR